MGFVSMESGLVGRNNLLQAEHADVLLDVSMESGLVGRNNREHHLNY